MTRPVILTPLEGLPLVEPGDDLAALHHEAARRAGVTLHDGALVVCQKIVSKAEDRLVDLRTVEPSAEALAGLQNSPVEAAFTLMERSAHSPAARLPTGISTLRPPSIVVRPAGRVSRMTTLSATPVPGLQTL